MFANTLTLTIGGVAKTLVRVNQDNFGSSYKFVNGTELITMAVRHSVDKGQRIVDRHNVFIERTIFATPSDTEKYFSVTTTLRAGRDSAPTDLLNTWIGASTLLLTLDDGLVIGEN